MDPLRLPASAKGKCRALPLDLKDIATAIQNLPADSSALLPTPALSAQFSGFLAASATKPRMASSSSSGDDAAASSGEPASSARHGTLHPGLSPSDDVYKRAVDHVMHRTQRQVQHKLAYGRTTLQKFEASVDQRQQAYGLAASSNIHASPPPSRPRLEPQTSHAERLQGALDTLREVWIARAARSQEVIDATGNIFIDEASVQVLTQSLVPRQNGSGSPSLPRFTPCQPGTVLSWTKYFRGTQPSSGTLNHAQGPADQPVSGQKRRLQGDCIPPAEKRRIISLSESPSQENTFQFQNLAAAGAPGGSSHGQQGRGDAAKPAMISFDLVSSVSSCPDLVDCMCQYLSLEDILALYRVSRVFKCTFDSNLKANVLQLARRFASPEIIAVFPWALYKKATVKLQTPNGQRLAPSLRYVNMLVSRQRKVRDIVACLARAGHRLPRTNTASALKKMWLLMDMPTNRGRAAFMQNKELVTDNDLLVMQMFRVKLEMHFTNPLRGPCHLVPDATGATAAEAGEQSRPQRSLVETLLGQRGGLHVLWSMLRGKAFRTAKEVIELKVRYDYIPSTLSFSDDEASDLGGAHCDASWPMDAEDPLAASAGGVLDLGDRFEPGFDSADLPAEAISSLDLSPELEEALRRIAQEHNDKVRRRALEDAIHAIPVWEMGVGHLEGWGLGTQHLLRPDELVTLEASRRRQSDPETCLDLARHVPFMPVWGARDFESGRNLVPGIDELYMSDGEEDGLLNSIDEDKENAWLEAHDKPSSMQTNIAAAVSADDGDVFEAAEARLSKYCGGVPLQHSDWQPWQVLKDQWDTLPQQDRLDVWWMNLQERLRRQGWSYRSTIDADRGNQVSYEEAVEDAEDEDDGLESDEGNGGLDHASGFSFSAPGSASPTTAAPVDSESLAPSLSARHQNIVQASIAWALREQDEVDAALLAQSDMPYEEDELEHWEQFLATVGPVLGADAGGGDGGGDDSQGAEEEMDDGPWGNEGGGAGSEHGSDSSEAASQQPPSPEAVLVPEYGCPKEVVRLARQTYSAEVALREAETGSAACHHTRQHAELAASANHLRRKLDAVIRGEVYAIEL